VHAEAANEMPAAVRKRKRALPLGVIEEKPR
jgi:hypothetical protein